MFFGIDPREHIKVKRIFQHLFRLMNGLNAFYMIWPKLRFANSEYVPPLLLINKCPSHVFIRFTEWITNKGKKASSKSKAMSKSQDQSSSPIQSPQDSERSRKICRFVQWAQMAALGPRGRSLDSGACKGGKRFFEDDSSSSPSLSLWCRLGEWGRSSVSCHCPYFPLSARVFPFCFL